MPVTVNFYSFYVTHRGRRSVAGAIKVKTHDTGQPEYYFLTERGGWQTHTSIHHDGMHHSKVVPKKGEDHKWHSIQRDSSDTILATVAFDLRLHLPENAEIKFPFTPDKQAVFIVPDGDITGKMVEITITTVKALSDVNFHLSVQDIPPHIAESANRHTAIPDLFVIITSIGAQQEPLYFIPYP